MGVGNNRNENKKKRKRKKGLGLVASRKHTPPSLFFAVKYTSWHMTHLRHFSSSMALTKRSTLRRRPCVSSFFFWARVLRFGRAEGVAVPFRSPPQSRKIAQSNYGIGKLARVFPAPERPGLLALGPAPVSIPSLRRSVAPSVPALLPSDPVPRSHVCARRVHRAFFCRSASRSLWSSWNATTT